MNARRIRAGEVLELRRRAVTVDLEAEYEEIGVRSFGHGIFHKEPITGADLGSKRVFYIEPGDLVISNVFAWEGAISVASAAETGKIGSHRFMTFVPKDDRVDTSWAASFFLSEQGMELIRKASPGSAGRNRTLAIERFEALEIPLPPIDQQRRVAARLRLVAEAARRSEEGWSAARVLSESFRQSLAMTGSDFVPFSDLVEVVQRPVNVEPDATYCLLGCRWYGEGLFVRERKLGTDISAKVVFAVVAGDLVYNRLFAWKGSFAIAGENVQDCFVSGEFPVLSVDTERVLPEYLQQLMSAQAFMTEVNLRSSGSTPTSRNRLKVEELMEIRVPVPSLSTQVSVVAVLGSVNAIERARNRQRLIMDALVPAALNEAFAELR